MFFVAVYGGNIGQGILPDLDPPSCVDVPALLLRPFICILRPPAGHRGLELEYRA